MQPIQKNTSLKNYNSFGIEVMAAQFASFSNADQLKEILLAQQEKGTSPENILILGGGSNLLFTDDFEGLVLKNEIKGIEIYEEDELHVYVKAGAGESWHQFVLFCLENNLAGAENLALIPGSVGAAPMQNIGAYGVELKEVFYKLDALHLATLEMKTFTKEACAFGYRESVFKNKCKNQFAICNVYFKLNKVPVYNISYGAIAEALKNDFANEISIQNIAAAVIKIRQSKLPDPKVIGNAGSFFKNPEVNAEKYQQLKKDFENLVAFPLPNGNYKLAAGWLIEQCGPEEGKSWKGFRAGDAGCYPLQALVLVNYGAASGKEIFSLAKEIRKSVEEKFGVRLDMEVNVYG